MGSVQVLKECVSGALAHAIVNTGAFSTHTPVSVFQAVPLYTEGDMWQPGHEAFPEKGQAKHQLHTNCFRVLQLKGKKQKKKETMCPSNYHIQQIN